MSEFPVCAYVKHTSTIEMLASDAAIGNAKLENVLKTTD